MIWIALLALVLFVVTVTPSASAPGGNKPWFVWFNQFGSPAYDTVRGIAADYSGVYVAGETKGTFKGQKSAGGTDAFIQKYYAGGGLAWTRQFGTSGEDGALGVAVDASGVYVAGQSQYPLPGQTWGYAFLRKYDVLGSEVWTRPLGGWMDAAYGVAVDASGVYVVFSMTTATQQYTVLSRYDVNGNLIWDRTLDIPVYNVGVAVETSAIQQSGVYVAGSMQDMQAGSYDGFVRKYDTNGNPVWSRTVSSLSGYGDFVQGISVYLGGVYLAGYTNGVLPGQLNFGRCDAFVQQYDPNGNLAWTRQFGTSDDDFGMGVAGDGDGVHVVGETWGTIQGQKSEGMLDAFVWRFDVHGSGVWARQFGTRFSDSAIGAAVSYSPFGYAAYITGWMHTRNDLDSYVARIA